MKKILSKILTTLLILTSLFAFAGCSNNDSSGSNTSDNNSTKNNQFTLYINSDPIENEKVKIEIQNISCYETSNYSLDISFKITNKEFENRKYTLKNIKLVKESTGAEYTVGGNYSNEISIDAELNKIFSLSSKIPTSIEDDNYKLSLEINDYKILCYLYEDPLYKTPDEIIADRTVNYYISNQLVKSDVVKNEGRIESLYTYESSDNLSYCSTWYTDEQCVTKFNTSTRVTSDINLYGKATSNFKWMTLSNDVYSFLEGVNHIPSNGILVLPQKNQNKELCIGNFAIKDIKVSEIYIPKTVHTIYGGNFTGIGNAIIYYEGTETEWKSLFYLSSDAITKNVVFNTPYSGN